MRPEPDGIRRLCRTYSTGAVISGTKLSNLASIDVGVHIAISHFSGNRRFSPEFCPTEPLKSAEKRVTARTEQ